MFRLLKLLKFLKLLILVELLKIVENIDYYFHMLVWNLVDRWVDIITVLRIAYSNNAQSSIFIRQCKLFKLCLTIVSVLFSSDSQPFLL